MNKIIEDFIDVLNKNAPLKSNDEKFAKYKYPYKAALLISVLTCIPTSKIFNNEIILDINSPILKSYYDLLMNSETIYTYLVSHSSKEEWNLGFDSRVKKQIINNIFEMPAKKLFRSNSDFWIIDKENKSIRMNIKLANENEIIILKDKLLSAAKESLEKCIPDYSNLSINEIIEYPEFLKLKLLTETISINKVEKRRYQYIYAKIIKDRDLKCKICCLDIPNLLIACHLKPYSVCDSEIEQYDEENGITMCPNHHKLFDDGLFTFTDEWKIIISKRLKDNDQDLTIKQFESCYLGLGQRNPFYNQYLKYHRDKIFIK